jgi:hypothetical protein
MQRIGQGLSLLRRNVAYARVSMLGRREGVSPKGGVRGVTSLAAVVGTWQCIPTRRRPLPRCAGASAQVVAAS